MSPVCSIQYSRPDPEGPVTPKVLRTAGRAWSPHHRHTLAAHHGHAAPCDADSSPASLARIEPVCTPLRCNDPVPTGLFPNCFGSCASLYICRTFRTGPLTFLPPRFLLIFKNKNRVNKHKQQTQGYAKSQPIANRLMDIFIKHKVNSMAKTPNVGTNGPYPHSENKKSNRLNRHS